jgi:hypothetical protein
VTYRQVMRCYRIIRDAGSAESWLQCRFPSVEVPPFGRNSLRARCGSPLGWTMIGLWRLLCRLCCSKGVLLLVGVTIISKLKKVGGVERTGRRGERKSTYGSWWCKAVEDFEDLVEVAKRCVTSFMRPVRHWPPRARMPAESTSRSCAGSCWYHNRGYKSSLIDKDGERWDEPRLHMQ